MYITGLFLLRLIYYTQTITHTRPDSPCPICHYPLTFDTADTLNGWVGQENKSAIALQEVPNNLQDDKDDEELMQCQALYTPFLLSTASSPIPMSEKVQPPIVANTCRSRLPDLRV